MNTSIYDPAQLLASLFKGGEAQAMNAEVEAAGESQGTANGTQARAADPSAGFTAFVNEMSHLQLQFAQQMAGFWSAPDTAGAAPEKETDKRFAGDAWRNDPRFAMVKQGYRAYAEFLQGTVDAGPLDAATKAQMRFGMRHHRRD
jgi:polyhydroxyalkanoate synthase